MLFSTLPRTDTTPKRHRESEFSFLERSARPEIARVRQFLEEAIGIYPGNEVDELCARIRSGNDIHFRSGTFELILHACLITLGYTLQPHPRLPHVPARPDFYVMTPDGREFYLEAVLASEANGTDEASEARIGTTLDFLQQASHPSFMVAVESEGIPASQPSGARLRSSALAWLNSLDPDQIQSLIEEYGFEATPTLVWRHEDWKVTLRPIPLPAEKRGKSTTLIGVLDGGAGLVDAWTPIRNTIKFKGSKYGELDKPLLVAVDVDTYFLDRIDEMQALYGQEQYIFAVDDPSREPRLERAPNGVWRGKKGPQYTRVSGAWIFNDLNPYTIASRRHTIYFNPWASLPLPDALKQMPHAFAEGGKMQWKDGISLRQVFALQDGWPQ